jgi:hypothetical protein
MNLNALITIKNTFCSLSEDKSLSKRIIKDFTTVLLTDKFNKILITELFQLHDNESRIAYLKQIIRNIYKIKDNEINKQNDSNLIELFQTLRYLTLGKIYPIIEDFGINIDTLIKETKIGISKKDVDLIKSINIDYFKPEVDSLNIDKILKLNTEEQLVINEDQEKIIWLYSLGVIQYLESKFKTASPSTLGSILEIGVGVKKNTIKKTIERIRDDNSLLKKKREFIEDHKKRLRLSF